MSLEAFLAKVYRIKIVPVSYSSPPKLLAYPLRTPCVPPRVRVPCVDYHCVTGSDVRCSVGFGQVVQVVRRFSECFYDFVVYESRGWLTCVGVYDGGCTYMAGENGRLIARVCKTVLILTH